MIVTCRRVLSLRQHRAPFAKGIVPGQRLFNEVRRMSAARHRSLEIVRQGIAIVGVHAICDNDRSALTRGKAAQIGQPDFRDQNIHIMFGMVDMADHRHDAGDGAALGNRLGDEDGHIGVAGKIPEPPMPFIM